MSESVNEIQRFGRTNGEPLVSIIVLNYNGVEWLARCFASIAAQTILPQIETVLVDNCSTDNSVEVARPLLFRSAHGLPGPKRREPGLL